MSVESDALVRHLNDRIANVMPWEVMICIRNNNTRRFRVMVGPPPLGEASWKGLPYQALRVRAVQGHHNELTRKYTEQAILTNLYSFDEEFTAAKYLGGQYPRAVRHPEQTDLWRRGSLLFSTIPVTSGLPRALSSLAWSQGAIRSRQAEPTSTSTPRHPGRHR